MASLPESVLERLKRADENIDNLAGEIKTFVNESPYAFVSVDDEELVRQFRKFWRNQPIPARFGVLVSEIVHHLRASLDNLNWHLPRRSPIPNENVIGFPILANWGSGTKKAVLSQKIGDISPGAQTIIEGLQPCKGVRKDPNDLLLILHDMNRFDKHRELTVIHSRPGQTVEYTLPAGAYLFPSGGTRKRVLAPPEGLEMAGHLVARIAFKTFGTKEAVHVVIGLKRLRAAVQKACDLLLPEFK